MVEIRAFRGIRPRRELAAKIASPPYDVLSSEEARQMAEGNPFAWLHVTKPEIDLDPKIDLYDDRVYAKAAENFRLFLDRGYFFQDAQPRLYAYRQIMGEHRQVGLVVCASVDDYEQNRIKKHELTRKDKEDDRARHVDTVDANAGPVFLLYRAVDIVDALIAEVCLNEPEYDITRPDGTRHTFWVISDQDMQDALPGLFAEVDCLYVADGHHRAASGWRVRAIRRAANPHHTGEEEYNYFLAVLFPHNQLQILDYNRAVKDLHGLSPEAFLKRVQEQFVLDEAPQPKPEAAHQFGMYLGGKWHRLTAKPGTFDETDPVKRLDVSIMQQNLLSPILGIADPRTDKRIDFVGGIRGIAELERLVNEGKAQVAFAMHPTSVEDLMAIADSGQTMPPKSTWFEPKLLSGLVIHKLSE